MGKEFFEIVGSFFGNIFSLKAYPLMFTDFPFWVFFLAVYLFFCIVRDRPRMRNAWLLLVSLFFYWKLSGEAVLVLLAVVLVSWLAGLVGRPSVHPSEHPSEHPSAHSSARPSAHPSARPKVVLALTVTILVGLLCYFKYRGFLTGMFKLADPEGNPADAVLLPAGISFFIFKAISYVVDVCKGKTRPIRNILDFGFFVTFFPALISGPIYRADEFVPQMHRKFSLSRRQFGMAMFWILNGLAKKLILSDYISANFISRVFDNPLLYTPFENLSAVFAYALQLYADFSGYTDIATGTALLMGFYLPVNFDAPYKSLDMREFWRRWHISLSQWLRDYLYIPLGGNRRATFASWAILLSFTAALCLLSGNMAVTAVCVFLFFGIALYAAGAVKGRKKLISNVNRMDTMLIGGLWHGAGWNFVTWGGLHGLGMVIYEYWKDWKSSVRLAVSLVLAGICFALTRLCPSGAMNVLFAFSLLPLCSALSSLFRIKWLTTFWAWLITFVFVSFVTMLFRTDAGGALTVVNQIGGAWNMAVIPQILLSYWKVFAIMAAGLTIHLLPARFKNRCRVRFASLPFGLLILVTILAVFILYQFVGAESQSFIYFQF